MICPNCGSILSEYAIKCDYCNYNIAAATKKPVDEKLSADTPAGNQPLANNTSAANNNPQPINSSQQTENYDYAIPVRWVGPRRVFHICSICSGLSAILAGYAYYTLMGLANFFTSAEAGMQAGVWCILFGIILIVLGIVGLVKIHSAPCCLALTILHLIAVLPFANYKYLLIPGTDIFVAAFLSLCTMGICGAALMKSEGVISGWLMLALLFGMLIYANVCFDGNQAGNGFWGNEPVQENSYGVSSAKVQATATPVPTEPPQTVSTGQNYEDSDYYSSYDNYEDDGEEYGEDEMEEDGDSDYIFPNSDSEYLTKADVKGMSSKELNLAKNELYARHGRIFDREDLQEHFDSCSWYEPVYSREEWDEKGDKYFFNEIEIKNRNFLVKREKKAKK